MILNLKHVRPVVIALLVLGVASTFVRGQRPDLSAGAAAIGDDTDLVGIDDDAETEAVDNSDNLTTDAVADPRTPVSHGGSRNVRISESTSSSDIYAPGAISTTGPRLEATDNVQRRVQVYSGHTTAPEQVQYSYQRVLSKSDPVDVENSKAIRKSVEKLRAAEDHNTRQAAAANLKKLLETAYDRDYERRNNELAKLEERVTKLRVQLDRRKESRDDIIDVRVKSLLYEAEGIGFPDELGAAPQGSVEY